MVGVSVLRYADTLRSDTSDWSVTSEFDVSLVPVSTAFSVT